MTERDNLVRSEHACPVCGERDADRLVWLEDEDRVECQMCGTVYEPGKKEPRP